MKEKGSRMLIGVLLTVLLLFYGMVAVAGGVYRANFGKRIATAPADAFSPAAFEGLCVEDAPSRPTKGSSWQAENTAVQEKAGR